MNSPTETGDPTVTLLSPVTFNGETFSKLTLHEPDVGCMIAAEDAGDGEKAQLAGLLAAMCDMPFEAFRKVKARDLSRIMDAAAHLLKNFKEGGEETGGTSPS